MYTYHTDSSGHVWEGYFQQLFKKKGTGSSKLLLKSTACSHLCSSTNTRCSCAAEPGAEFQPSDISCWAGTLPPALLELDKFPQWFSMLQTLKLFNFKVLHIPFPIMDESTTKLLCFHNYAAVKMHMHSLPFKLWVFYRHCLLTTFSILPALHCFLFLFSYCA